MNMQSGFGDTGNGMMEQYIQTMTNIMLPVMEKSALLAAEYSKACGRDVSEPEGWSFSNTKFKIYESGLSSSDDSSDDEELFSKTKSIKKKKFKKVVEKEELLPE